MQSELELQWPHVLLEHVPKPAQSDVELQYGVAGVKIPAGESVSIDAARRALSASNAGTGTGLAGRWSLVPQAPSVTSATMTMCFIARSYHYTS